MIKNHFIIALTAAVTLGLGGCSDESSVTTGRGAYRVRVMNGPFGVGRPRQYQKSGVYDRYRKSHGIWLVSNGEMLVALCAACPVDGNGTVYDSTSEQFTCPGDGSRFDSQGLYRGDQGGRSLERCRIALVGELSDPDGYLQVMPSRRFRQEDNQWSSINCLYEFEEEK